MDTFYISIILAGFGGGAVRNLVGFAKQFSFTKPTFDLKYFLMTMLVSGAVGLIAAVVTKELDISILGISGFTPAIAFLVGYAGGDLLDNLYKIILRNNRRFNFMTYFSYKKLFLITLIIFAGFGLGVKAEAADYYINRDCANNGDGSSWSCAGAPSGAGAFNNIPADSSCVFNGYSWVRGSTYWVAGSDTSYGTGCFRLNNGTGTITLKKASASSHGTDTGWQSSYGTKQAVLGQISINISNVTIDGSYRTGVDSGYGFKIQAAGSNNLISNPNNTVTTGTTIKYAELMHTSFNTSSASGIALYGNGGNTIQYVWVHDMAGLCFKGNMDPVYHTTSGLTNTTIEESACGDTGMTTGSSHNELLKDDGASSGTTIKNNLFYNWGDSSSTGGLILSDGQTNWNIYNNIFTERSENATCGNGVISGLTAGSGWTGIKVYNNTFANISTACSQIFAAGSGDFSGTGNEVKNNLFYNTTVTAICSGGCTKSKNWFYNNSSYTPSGDDISGAADPFVNSASENFHLAAGSSPINAGLDLSSTFTTDKDGVTRPVGAWDIGAYEYVASSAKAITSFNFNGLSPAVTGTVNEGAKTVSLTVPYGTNVTALVPTIVHTGSSISPNTGVAQNFTSPVTYTVTAEDATTQAYTVTVTVASNTETSITSFDFASPAVTGTVDNTAHTVALTVPFSTTVTSLTPTIVLATGATISPNTGVATNFTNPVTYTVTAQDGTTQQTYTVTVTVAADTTPAPAAVVANGPPQSGHRNNISNLLSPSTSLTSLKNQITQLTAQPQSLIAQKNALTSTTPQYTFTRNLSLNDKGEDVKNLQKRLNSLGFIISRSGAGSPGNETTLFGTLTYKALQKFQKSVGLPASGFFGPMTREYVNKK